MIVPASNSESELPRTQEYNHYHDRLGRFASHRGRVEDSGAAVGVLKVLQSHFQQWKRRTGNVSWTDFLFSRKRDWTRRLQEFNRCHEPAGSGIGGRFARKGTGVCEDFEALPPDTKQLYSKDGVYTAERLKLHDRIVDELTRGIPKSANATVYMTGGGPASGKSTMVDTGLVKFPPTGLAVYANPDAVKARIPEYQAMVLGGDHRASTLSHEESSDITFKVIMKALSNGQDIVLDGVGDSSIDKLTAKLEGFRKKGYRVVADYATNSVDLAIRLSDQGALKPGPRHGRYTPHPYIREAHRGVSQVVPRVVRRGLFTEFRLWDTNKLGEPRLVASARGPALVIHNKRLWKSFRLKARKKTLETG